MSLRPGALDAYHSGRSPLHRLPAPVKLAAAVILAAAVALAPRSAWGFDAVAALLLTVAAALSRIPARLLLARLLAVEPLAAGVALLSLLQPGGAAVAAALLVKSTLCLLCFVLVGMTTPFTDLLQGLSALRLPALLVTSLALAYRYLFLLVEEAGRMGRARAARTYRRSRRLEWGLSATVLAQLFLRSAGRAERVYAAMCARGFGRERG